MPELPEVEVVREGLAPFTGSWVIDQVEIFDARSLRRHPGRPEDFVTRLTGATLLAAVRRGKFLWFPLHLSDGTTDYALVAHLGMSGQMLLGESAGAFGRLLRVALHLSHPEGRNIVVGFVDQRLFGSLAIDELVSTSDGHPAGRGSADHRIPAQVTHIARDPLDPHFDLEGVVARIRRKHTGIKRTLLDQQVLSGVGNIYADEALFASKLHFDYPSNRLSPASARELLSHVSEVFQKALAEGGTSFDWQYVNVNGQSGYFSHSLNAYGQDGQPCFRCGRTILREAFMNRSSYRCPGCQPRPRGRVS